MPCCSGATFPTDDPSRAIFFLSLQDELGEDPLTLAESKKPRASEEEGEEEEEEEVEEELGTRVSRITLQFERRCRQVVWHHKGDYFATYTPERASKSVLVHRLSQNHSMAPFGKSKG